MSEKQKIIRAVLDSATNYRIVGKVRLQKVFCLLHIMDEVNDFQFRYHYYGPYSEQLDSEITLAPFGKGSLILEKTQQAAWGGRYSVYESTTEKSENGGLLSENAKKIIALCTQDGLPGVDVELAVTAAWLAENGEDKPWRELKRLKWEKADRISAAKSLYKRIKKLDSDDKLPSL